ncbi:MAG: hypothetical protein KC729_14590 [Candidatus Eisenbacteria bacterium]|uniref:Uncharacterized protein n=1 Tax=Eiseniibacteriota bacterium TaxID=2212470 RepID=A0A956M300_UNCEI|nr:hypothetical protein [Candidatus Eisenbacteria bacterium]
MFVDGNLRFVCQQGVDICDLPSFDVLDLSYLGDELFLATGEGVVAQREDGTWTERNAGLPTSDTILRRLEPWQGQLLGAGPDAVHRWDGTAWSELGAGLPAGFVPFDLFVDGADVWVAGGTSGAFADQGVFVLSADTWTRVGTTVFTATSVVRTASGRLFATATDPTERLDGLWELAGGDWVQHRVPGPPERAHYRSVTVDTEGRVWFSTAESGKDPLVGTYDGNEWVVRNGGQNGAARAWTWSVLPMADMLFLAHCCCSVSETACQLETFTESAEEFRAISGIREAWSLDRDTGGDVWVSTNNANEQLSHGIYRYRPSTGEVVNFNPENTALTSEQNPAIRVQGNRRWIGSSNDGVDLWDFGPDGQPYGEDTGTGQTDDDVWVHFSTTSSNSISRLIGDTITRIEVAADGAVWIGTTEGISIYKNGAITSYGPRFDRVPTAQITALALTSEGGAWVGSRNGGLTRMRPNDAGGFDFTNYRPPLLPNPNIDALAISADGRSVWCGTTRGLARFTPVDRASAQVDELGAYPNPFRPGCTDGVRLKGAGGLAGGVVVDMNGRVLHRFEETAPDEVVWNGEDADGPVAPGLYLVRLRAAVGVRTVAVAVLDGDCP